MLVMNNKEKKKECLNNKPELRKPNSRQSSESKRKANKMNKD